MRHKQVGVMAEQHPLPRIKVRRHRYRAWLHRPDGGIRGPSVARALLGFMSLAIAACFSMSLHAQSTSFSGTAALSSELVDRGQAITGNTPILQGAASWTSAAGWSLGLSGSTEIRSPGRVVEALAQASRYWSLSSDWQMQATLLYYRYPGETRSKAYDRAETGVNWTYRDVLTFGMSAIYVIGAREHQPRGAADLSFHWPLAWRFSLSAGVGVAQPLIAPYSPYPHDYTGSYDYDRTGLHGYGHAGLLWSHGPWLIELDRIMADPETQRQWATLGASPWVATISRSF
jgi:uncharacterized protein (TIGR02001 family)